MTNRIAFVGAGKMVSAIVKSLLNSNLFNKKEITCCSANDGTSDILSKSTGIQKKENILDLLSSNPDALVLGCKPQQINDLPNEIRQLTGDTLILSIMAGIPLSRLSESFPKARNIVRSMPNTPGQIGSGITAFLFAKEPKEDDRSLIEGILGSLGVVKEVAVELDIDRVTAISGSGPAYIFEFTCALQEAGKAIGLSEEYSNEFAKQTVIGAAKLMENSSFTPEELRNQVTSPNGTTQAALESLSANKFRNIISEAAKSAKSRSIELSNA
jgi:pyrroline-5-carboxylate reductase